MKISMEYPRFQIQNAQNQYGNFRIRRKELHDYDLHWHDCFEIELILSGEAFQELNGEKYNLSKGDIYLLNPTDFHKVQTDGAEVYNIMFGMELLSDDILQKILTVKQNLVFHLKDDELEHIVHLMDRMLLESHKREEYADEYICKLLECIFLTILRKCTDYSNDESAGGMQEALLYMHGHFREDPAMTFVAELFGFNPNYFSARFHYFTGKTFKQYLNLLKLDYAKKLILSGDLSITEIGYASGFSSLANFLRCFKTHFGISPKAMRGAHKNDI